MTSQGPFIFTVVLLIFIGAGTAAFRHQEYQVPFFPGEQQTLWQVQARVEFRAHGEPTQALLTLPPVQSGFRVLNELPISSVYGDTLDLQANQHRLRWSARDAIGNQVLFYKLEIIEDEDYQVDRPPIESITTPPWNEPYLTAAQQILELTRPKSADGYTLAQQIIGTMNPPDQNMTSLFERYSRSQVLSYLLAMESIGARTVQALNLEDGRRRQQLVEMVEVWGDDGWRLFDPNAGSVIDTSTLLLWRTTNPAVLEVTGGTRSRVSFSMISQTRSSLALAIESKGSLSLSLYDLPIEEQGVFKLIMLLPIGALVVVLMRVLVGFRTSGTFMPVLIALAFLQTKLVPGVVSFLIVVSIGLVIRTFLSALNLLLVARIATLIVLVVGLISIFSVISFRLGLISGLTITFFPMIILAWTIERMSITWEEEGPKEVLIQGGGSLLVAIFAYLMMSESTISHLAFNFPELHLCVLALIMILGRYTGYRLSELTRFASLQHK